MGFSSLAIISLFLPPVRHCALQDGIRGSFSHSFVALFP